MAAGHRRDISKMMKEAEQADISRFHSVDEVFFFLESMLEEGITEDLLNKALDTLLRDAGLFKEEDLEKENFGRFLRELSASIVWLEKGKTFVKIARFLDLYCVGDPFLWVNLENFIVQSDGRFTASEYISILGSFAGQGEGSNDFYDMFEFMHNSDQLKSLSTNELISLGYYFYIVHHGSEPFFRRLHTELIHAISDDVSTFDLLRVL